MNNSVHITQLVEAKLDLEEAVELIEVARQLFQKKLGVIQQKLDKAQNDENKMLLEQQARDLFDQYKQSLKVIENYIDEVSQSGKDLS